MKFILKKIINYFGYSVVKKKQEYGNTNFQKFIQSNMANKNDLINNGFYLLKKNGFNPKHIIDVGANKGTWTREVFNIFPDESEFRELLKSGKRLRFYWGVDATAPTLHLSHAKNFILLEELENLVTK